MKSRNPSEELNAHMVGRLRTTEAAWQSLAPDASRQQEAAEALLDRLRGNADPSVASLILQLEHLVAQLQATTLRIDHHLPLAARSAQRVETLQAVVNRQNLLREYEDLLDVHPHILPARPMLGLLEDVWRKVMREGSNEPEAGTFTAWESRLLDRIEKTLLDTRRVTALLLAGCANPFLVTRLWKKARVAVNEPDPVLCHWIQGLISRLLLAGEGGAVNIESKAVTFMDAIQLPPRAFDLIWFGEDFWDSWSKAEESELLTALGQLSGRVEYLAVSLRAEALASCRTLLKDAGYAVEDEWQDGEAGTPVTLLAHNAAVSAGGIFYLEVSAVTHDSVVEYLTNRPPLPEESVALPTPTVALAVASPSPASDPGYSSIRTRLACAADRVIVSFHSPARVRQDELEAAGHLGWHLHSLRGICPQIPALRSGASTQNPLVVLEIEGLPIPLMNCDPAQLVWPEVFHDVLELLSALLKRGWHLNGLRPGWFVHTPQGLRLCSLNSLAREETEDALSALWWFFHDLASGGPRWREWPVPPPEGDLPVLIPAEIRQKITTLLEGETLSDALASLDTH